LQKGNPWRIKKGDPPLPGGGRPKADFLKAEIERIALDHSAEALQELIRIGRKAKSDMARIVANDKVLDRAAGKPRQSIEQKGSVSIGVVILPAEEPS
jgi:hypothetical protein